MSKPLVLPRKISRSILEGIEVLCSASFTEKDVKALLIDLREPAKYLKGSLDTNDYTNHLNDFIEVCDFMAHASRDRGLIEKTVRNHVKNLHTKPNLTSDKFAKLPIARVLNADDIVLALAVVSAFVLDRLDKQNQTIQKEIIEERRPDIGLCIMSLLQDSFICLKEGGYGVLQLMPYEGKYRLYCQVHQSIIEREAKDRTGGKGKLILGAPVMISSAKCIDPAILSCDHEVFPFQIFETFRDKKLCLQVRAVEDASDT